MKKYINILFGFIFFLQGCSVIENEDDSQNLLPVEGKLLIEIREDYETYDTVSDPEVYITLTTEKIYPCMNYGISSSYNVNRDRIEILINGIAEPGVCLTALGPAVRRYKIGKLTGTKKLIIKTPDSFAEYQLTADDNFIRIEGRETQFTSIVHRQFNRFPVNSFVYACGTTTADSALCTKFIDTVKSVISIQQFEFPESGVIPYRESMGGSYYNHPVQYYKYNSEEDFMKISSIMKSFKDVYIKDKQGILLSVRNWRNLAFHSWLM